MALKEALDISSSKLGWYTSWMKLEDAKETRSQQLAEYTQVIESRGTDAQHLLRFSHLLQYEVCAVLFDRSTDDGRPVLTSHPAAFKIVEALSTKIFNTVTPNHHFECELQNRNLLTSLLLLEAHGVEAIDAERFRVLEKNMMKLVEDINSNKNSSSTFDQFRRAQSSVFILASLEFQARFKKAEPRAFTALRQLLSLASFALTVAGPALGGGTLNLKAALQELGNAIEPFWRTGQHEFEKMFTIYQATLLVNAFHHVNTVRSMMQRAPREDSIVNEMPDIQQVREAISDFTKQTVSGITAILEDLAINGQELQPPPTWRAMAQDIIGQRLLHFKKYHAVLLLLDAATQLKCLILGTTEATALEAVGMKIALSQKHQVTIRCKAIEYILTGDGYPRDQINSLQREKKQNPQIGEEISLVLEYLYGKRQIDCLRRPSSVQSVSVDSPLATTCLNRADWVEAKFTVNCNTSNPRKLDNPDTRKGLYKSVGISPNGKLVYFLKPTTLTLQRLQDAKIASEVATVTNQNSSKGYDRAALTDDWIAIIAVSDLYVSQVSALGNHQMPARPCARQGWAYLALALHKFQEQTFLALASSNSSSGRIEVFELCRGESGPVVRDIGAQFGNSPLTEVIALEFSPNGKRLACLRNNSTVLVFQLVCGRPFGPPFEFGWRFEQESVRKGITAAIPFNSPGAGRPYLLAPTAPSHSRAAKKENLGEWTYITPTGPGPCEVPRKMMHSMHKLGKAGAMIGGAVSPQGNVVALAEDNGDIWICPLEPDQGRLRTAECQSQRMAVQNLKWKPKKVSLRFVPHTDHLDRYDVLAVDNYGRVVRISLETPTKFTQPDASDLDS